MSQVYRVYVTKKKEFAVEAKHLLEDIRMHLAMPEVEDVVIMNRYDITGFEKADLVRVIDLVLCDPVVDEVYTDELENAQYEANRREIHQIPKCEFSFSSEYLPGQYDQRADSTEQCIRIILNGSSPLIRTAKLYRFFGNISEADREKIKKYIINPVDSRVADEKKPESLEINTDMAQEVEVLTGFLTMDKKQITDFHVEYALAMSVDDLLFCQEYFQKEKRNPTITEIKVIDTYWSDHCRHTTFSTIISSVVFEDCQDDVFIRQAFQEFKADFDGHYSEKRPLTLMDMATLRMKVDRKESRLSELVVSDEINACTVEIDVNTPEGKRPYNLLFKNETHNHPTEIEPFGGAATCLGGAIRDPLSGRAYVYQSMRVTGSADPRQALEDTLEGKLPQRKITTEAADGFSSYGNQIGLATGLVREYYHPAYVAKRLECGCVIGVVASENVKRQKPLNGDLILLIGGATGRDGCGGATGSSKSHDADSIKKCGAEVQKGNAPTERKLQRLFRNPEISRRIKKCNDFGAGGVSVAIGELADGLDIDLDAVEKKYAGLDGTELAISESQERMAVVISPEDLELFKAVSSQENLNCSVVARVTDSGRLRMNWNSSQIVDLSREFLDTNGITQKAKVYVKAPDFKTSLLKSAGKPGSFRETLIEMTKYLNLCSQMGLSQRFDSTVGACTALFPFGGRYQKTPSDVMAALIPVFSETDSAETNKKDYHPTVSLMAHGFDPQLSEWSPFHGGMYAVVLSCSRLISAGADPDKIWLSLQEFFESLREDPTRWGKPFAAMLGAYKAQKELNYAAIGGKDSMSGSFKDLDVSPTLISFGLGISDENNLCSNELKRKDSQLVYLKNKTDAYLNPDFDSIRTNYRILNRAIKEGGVLSCSAVDRSGILFNLCIRSFGNKIGFEITHNQDLLSCPAGSLLIECDKQTASKLVKQGGILMGNTISDYVLKIEDEIVSLSEIEENWMKPLEDIFPLYEKPNRSLSRDDVKKPELYKGREPKPFGIKTGKKPMVFIPVFPGTNCEYDTQQAFENAQSQTSIKVFKNLKPDDIEESADIFASEIEKSQMIALPGGFSAGDEPDGSGKFISAVFRHPKIKKSITRLLENRDGLILGICNGFQALLRLGLLPFGEYRYPDEDLPTLTFNSIGRHISSIVDTKVISTKSPWFPENYLDKVFKIPISHTEGRFFCTDKMFEDLSRNGQIASCYCTPSGEIEPSSISNPNGSTASIEAITSPDGRILGKMGHNERVLDGLYKNVPDVELQDIFSSGVDYFK